MNAINSLNNLYTLMLKIQSEIKMYLQKRKIVCSQSIWTVTVFEKDVFL